MNNSLKTSIYTWFGYYLPFKERLELIKNAGFDEVMVSWEDEYPPFELSRFDFAKEASRLGMGITNAHSPFIGYNRIWQDSPEESQDLLELYKSWIVECSASGIDTLVIHTNDTDLVEKPYNRDNGIRFFDKLVDHAQKYNFNIAIENVTRQFLIDSVLDKIESDNLGICYDCGHDFITYCGLGRLLDKYPNRIKALHLHDNDLFSDKHWLPGEGRIDYSAIMPRIFKSGYKTVSLEVKADPAIWAGKSAEEFLERAHKSALDLSALV